jgi:hypothetical protein
MNSYFLVSVSGWVTTLLIATEILLAYLLRPGVLSRWLGIAAAYSGGALRKMRPHYVLGAALPILSFAHAWIPMAAGRMRGMNQAGLWLATLALLLLVIQPVLGSALTSPYVTRRRGLRRMHFVGMLVLSGLVLAHIVLND